MLWRSAAWEVVDVMEAHHSVIESYTWTVPWPGGDARGLLSSQLAKRGRSEQPEVSSALLSLETLSNESSDGGQVGIQRKVLIAEYGTRVRSYSKHYVGKHYTLTDLV